MAYVIQARVDRHELGQPLLPTSDDYTHIVTKSISVVFPFRYVMSVCGVLFQSRSPVRFLSDHLLATSFLAGVEHGLVADSLDPWPIQPAARSASTSTMSLL